MRQDMRGRAPLVGAILVITGATMCYNLRINVYTIAALAVAAVLLTLPSKTRTFGICLTFLLAGIAVMSCRILFLTAGELEGSVEGRLCAYPVKTSSGSIQLELDGCKINGHKTRGRVRVYAKNAPESTEPGNILRCEGTLTPPSPRMNPHCVDSRANLWAKGVIYTINTEAAQNLGGVTALTYIMRIRARMEYALAKNADVLGYGVLKGLLFGDTSGIDGETLEAMRGAGAGHLFAVSGLHIGLIAGALGCALGLLRVSRGRRLLAVLAFLIIWIILIGGTPSVLRAAVMYALLELTQLFGEQPDMPNILGITALVNVLINPASCLSASFMLSYGAMAGLCAFGKSFAPLLKRLEKRRLLHAVISTAATAFCALLGILLPQALLFGTVTPASILTNMLIAPLVPIVMILGMAGALMGACGLPLAGYVCCAACCVVRPIVLIGGWVDSLPNASINTGAPSLLTAAGLALIMLAAGVWICVKRQRLAAAVTGLALLAVSFVISGAAEKGVTLTLLYAGNSDAMVLRSGGATVLIDGGNAYNGYDAGKTVLLPYLRGEGVRRLEAAIATHPHSDHYGGLVSTVAELDTGIVMLSADTDIADYGRLGEAAAASGVPVAPLHTGDVLTLGEAKLTVLDAPGAGMGNDSSLMLLLECGQNSVLLTGDATEAEERKLLETLPDADVLKVGHHGAKESSCAEFLQRIQPEYAVISVGKRNSYGHPAPETLERLQAAGAEVIRTDISGALTIRLDGKLRIDGYVKPDKQAVLLN